MSPTLPPGPRVPRLIQTAGFMLAGPRFLEACRRRYGNAVTFGTLFDERFVMVFDPELVKDLFRGSVDQLHAGEANALLGPILGERSVPLLDGAEHLRHRRLMLPPFHGQRMLTYAEIMRESADLEIDSWPVGEPFALLGSLQSLTLRVILRAVFGYEPGHAEDELRRRLRAMVEPLARPRGLLMMATVVRGGRERRGAIQFQARKRVVDEYLDAVVKESLRIRPVIPGVGRVVKGEPFALNGYEIPPGIEINPSIRVIHRRADIYPDPQAFRPERFLGDQAPDTYTWVPFGGGPRRCLGASFALMEMRIVLRRVLERTVLTVSDRRVAKVQFRAITLAPKGGVRVVQPRAPTPGAAGEPQRVPVA